MAGSIRMDGEGVASLAALVRAQATQAGADGPLQALSGSASSAPLASALEGFASRFTGQSNTASDYIDSLGTALNRVGDVFAETDATIAASARRMQ